MHMASPISVERRVLPRWEGAPDKLVDADRKIREYDAYLEELYKRFPQTYHRMREFMLKGSCRCGYAVNGLDVRDKPCSCHSSGQICVCPDRKFCQVCPGHCDTAKAEDAVYVYDIDPHAGKSFDEFYRRERYLVSDANELSNLRIKLAADIPDRALQDPPQVPLSAKASNNNSFWDSKPCRIIAVSHLYPQLVCLLGGIYDIAADFFNRHLPGTEAISGKLVSRLPSTVQMDFDELYEGTETFHELFHDSNELRGHRRIHRAIGESFNFGVGWDYFPISKIDWEKSRDNYRLTSGYEIAMDETLNNVFQFNLFHRISIFSQPPHHPQTAIIIFYPKININCNRPEHGQTTVKHVSFRSIPNVFPNPSQLKVILQNTDEEWEIEKEKQGLCQAFDGLLHIHMKRHFDDHCSRKSGDSSPKEKNAASPTPGASGAEKDVVIDQNTFVHMFAFPIFKIMAANWARLIVRRSFDLDLLEWRPRDRLTSRTVDEIKSRRIAIARHQRSIKSCLDHLRPLAEEERCQKCKEDGRDDKESGEPKKVNALVGKELDDDSWESTYWDFHELNSSIDLLEARATKIQDGMLGLIQVYAGEQSSTLNKYAFLFSIVLLPFSILGTIWSAGLHAQNSGEPRPPRDLHSFEKAVFITFFVILALIVLAWQLEPVQVWNCIVFYSRRLLSKVLFKATASLNYKAVRKAKSRWQSVV